MGVSKFKGGKYLVISNAGLFLLLPHKLHATNTKSSVIWMKHIAAGRSTRKYQLDFLQLKIAKTIFFSDGWLQEKILHYTFHSDRSIQIHLQTLQIQKRRLVSSGSALFVNQLLNFDWNRYLQQWMCPNSETEEYMSDQTAGMNGLNAVFYIFQFKFTSTILDKIILLVI